MCGPGFPVVPGASAVQVWLASPLLSRSSFPVALGASVVQVWLPRGPGRLHCPGLASPPLCGTGFPVLLLPSLAISTQPPCRPVSGALTPPWPGPVDACLLPMRGQYWGISRAARSCSRACCPGHGGAAGGAAALNLESPSPKRTWVAAFSGAGR